MQPLDAAAMHAITAHYATRRHQGYARWKIACDPAYAATLALLGASPLPLLDVGCGIGLLGQYLRAAGARGAYVGIDHDEGKIAIAQAAAEHAGIAPHVEFRCADVADLPPAHGHVVLLDVLHYLPRPRQQALLAQILARRADRGLIVIRNVLREANWRYHATRIEEFFLRASGWIPGGAQHYPSADELRQPLAAAGLDVRVTPLHGRTPYNSYLIVARAPQR